jgi:hypothetical protein
MTGLHRLPLWAILAVAPAVAVVALVKVTFDLAKLAILGIIFIASLGNVLTTGLARGKTNHRKRQGG